MFSDIGVNASIATEFQVIEPHSYVLAELGFISLVPDNRQTNRAVFLTAPSVHKFPAHLKETNTVEEWNYSLNIHLPYRFIACRIAHYAKALFRGLRGQYGTVERINTEMQRLMDRYIEAQHLGNQQLQARFPIRKARTTAKETGRAGVYEVVVEIEPITQITEVGIVISLTSVADDKP
jgi:type VI secretion system protein ImpC